MTKEGVAAAKNKRAKMKRSDAKLMQLRRESLESESENDEK